jgi:hypothetical protein
MLGSWKMIPLEPRRSSSFATSLGSVQVARAFETLVRPGISASPSRLRLKLRLLLSRDPGEEGERTNCGLRQFRDIPPVRVAGGLGERLRRRRSPRRGVDYRQRGALTGKEQRDTTRPFTPALRGYPRVPLSPRCPVNLTVVSFARVGRPEQDTISSGPSGGGSNTTGVSTPLVRASETTS